MPPRLARPAGRAAHYRGATAHPGQLRPHRAPVARGATETGRGPATRVDDLVRTERYFCALLLSLLLDEASAGVRALVELLVEKGILRTGLAGAPISPESTQVITELAVRRDLQKHRPGEQLPADAPGDVVDVVVIAGGLLIAIEARFFSPTSVAEIASQLASQRAALRLLEARQDCGVTRVCQVFLTADPALDRTRLPGAGVLHWSDVLALAERVRGPQSYVARRLRSALDRYEEELGASASRPGPYCAVTEGLAAVLRRCRAHGPQVVVGFLGGMPALQARTMAELDDRPFKWDWADGSRGRKVQKHWIPGDAFAAAIDALAAREDGRGAPGATGAPSGAGQTPAAPASVAA